MKSILVRYSLGLLVVLGSGFFSFLFLPLTLYTSYFLLKIFTDVQLVGSTLSLASGSFAFISACAASLAYVLLLLLLLFTRGISFVQGAKMFLFGGSMIFLLNIFRILFLIGIYVNYGKNYFDLVHIFFWHFVSTIFVAGVWIFLVERYKIRAIPLVSDIRELLR